MTEKPQDHNTDNQWDEVSPEDMRHYMEERAGAQRNRFIAIILTLVVIGGISLFAWMRGREEIQNVIETAIPASTPAPTAEPPPNLQNVNVLVQRRQQLDNDMILRRDSALEVIALLEPLIDDDVAPVERVTDEDIDWDCRYLAEEVSFQGWGYIQQYYNRGNTSDFYYRVGDEYVAYQNSNPVREGMELCRK